MKKLNFKLGITRDFNNRTANLPELACIYDYCGQSDCFAIDGCNSDNSGGCTVDMCGTDNSSCSWSDICQTSDNGSCSGGDICWSDNSTCSWSDWTGGCTFDFCSMDYIDSCPVDMPSSDSYLT